MKSKIVMFMSVLLLTAIALPAQTTEETTSGGSGSVVVPSIPSFESEDASLMVVPDLSMLTNHATLVSWAFKQIRGVKMQVGSGAQAKNILHTSFVPIDFKINTLEGLSKAMSQVTWNVTMADTSKSIWMYQTFWNTNVEAYANFSYSANSASELFNAYGDGKPIQVRNTWTLSESDSVLSLRIAQVQRIKANVADARQVSTDTWGNPYGRQLFTGDGWFEFSPNNAGNGSIILSFKVPTANGGYTLVPRQYSLTNNTELPINDVTFKTLLRGSEDITEFKGSSQIDVSIPVYQGYGPQGPIYYGKVPLIIGNYDNGITSIVKLSVHSSDGQFATSYILENQINGARTTINVPPGSKAVSVAIPSGVYHIFANGLNLNLPAGYYGKG